MSEAPKLKLQRFYVYTGDPDNPEGYEARVIWGDQLRGELEASRRNISQKAQPMLVATFWVWAEACRTGRTGDKFEVWREQLVDVQDADKIDKERGEETEQEEDPT